MRKYANLHAVRAFSDRRWILPFFASLLVSVTLFLAAVFGLFCSPYAGDPLSLDFVSSAQMEDSSDYFVESDLRSSLDPPGDSRMEPPRIAYLISGTKGDAQRMRRTLQAVYHPRNQYILHLDLEAPPRERIELATLIKNDPTFCKLENVQVMAKSNLVTYKGSTMIASTLQAVAILLKFNADWDWFINLSASDYPLVTQDDLLHVFYNLSRDLNFIEHTEIDGWKLKHRARPVFIDPGLYLSKKFEIFRTSQRRSLPTSFKLFTGSAWVMLTRPFLEFCILGWDNFPRTVLMYFTNFLSSPESYFHTVICHTEQFRTTAVNHDLHYIAWDNPPKQHPRYLTVKDFNNMVKSGAVFARKFAKDDPVLDKIDQELLGRPEGQFAPGAWCIGSSDGGADPCSLRGDDSVFRPGPGAVRLQELLQKLLSVDLYNQSCSSPGIEPTNLTVH
ncbi:beta-glucuronosyltransferase GlcAT14B-like [Macadamia integrifolia]|uniref:beta-glucuronosyltransferase GlcAT14B-like n=1 Tax=Macadamia integrifolia TaxID=60698 RepID=UPI001C4E4AAB|nr:beta-glucuronosyltransferase GlcAT14B-like [Macadamia integrifolia]XP_042490614.1 beta-glucuronosyltransferase GlcAT14B-like [Macadamia integrifolia]